MQLHTVPLLKNAKVDLRDIDIVSYPKGYTIEQEGNMSTYIGIVLSGSIVVKSYSLAGHTFIIRTLTEGMMYGDVLIYGSHTKVYPGTLIAREHTQIAKLKNNLFKRWLNESAQLLTNYLKLLSDKTFELNNKNKLLSQDTLRDKILYYLYEQKKLQDSNIVTLDQSKEELAEALYVRRPSLSRELAKMKNEGLIDYDRHTITIKVN
ncbi:MAG: Crp/Fnr family transcriptional regulator [Candidatus Izimaplasma sp.]|nr:Crp/Fnr family transcriptional regulator [Candidatus Izimaplasma bacterium]